MKYYKFIDDGYIISIGTGGMGDEISEDEYLAIKAVIARKPADTEASGYRLKTDLTWEEYPIDPPDPDPEIDDLELLEILMGVTE